MFLLPLREKVAGESPPDEGSTKLSGFACRTLIAVARETPHPTLLRRATFSRKGRRTRKDEL
jgi:hypothetical protein